MPRRTFALTAGLAVAVALAASPGARAAAAPPAPCAGTAITDRAGDQLVYPTPIVGLRAQAEKGPDNLDLRSLFFNFETAGEQPSLTANLRVTNLTTAVPEEAWTGTVSYWITFEPSVGNVSALEAFNNNGEFSYGAVLGDGPAGDYVSTTGRLFEGPNGVVQIDVPLAEARAEAGTQLRGLSADVTPDPGIGIPADRAPEDGTRSATVTPCPPPAAATPPAATKKRPAKSCKAKARKIKNAKKRKAAIKRCRKQRARAR